MIANKPKHMLPSKLLQSLRWASLAVLLLFGVVALAVQIYPQTYLYPALPRVTQTSGGSAGDPINIMIIGSHAQISASFARASWLVPDPITVRTSALIAADSLTHRPYPTAPVSNLYVFGRHQDLAFELPTNDVENRGHIRLWQTAIRFGGQPVWLGAASYDHGIELSSTSGLLTHHILPTVNIERDAVGADLRGTGLVAAEAHEPFAPPAFIAFNGGGDYYANDGQVLAVSFIRSTPPAPNGPDATDATLTRELFRIYDAVLSSPLLSVLCGAALASLIVLAIWPMLSWTWRHAVRKIPPDTHKLIEG